MTGTPPDLSQTPEFGPAYRAGLVREGLRCLQVAGAVFLRAHFTAPWCYTSPDAQEIVQMLRPGDRRVVLFHVFTEGRCQLALDSGQSSVFEAGDVAIVPGADRHRVGSPTLQNPTSLAHLIPPPPWTSLPEIHFGQGGERTSMVCGYLYCDDTPFNPVLGSLPRLLRVRPNDGPLARWIAANLDYAVHASERRVASDPLLQRLPELLFIESLCDFAANLPEGETGWLAALADPVLGRALADLHRDPARPWTVQTLARCAATSRSVLDERFRALLGRAPMGYLTAWRLQLASRQLRTTSAGLAEVADAVGYASEASFSRAFKRHVGVSPSVWRAAQQ